jgi:hypothetical protein
MCYTKRRNQPQISQIEGRFVLKPEPALIVSICGIYGPPGSARVAFFLANVRSHTHCRTREAR